MKNNIAKIRAALEMARDYITSDLASERGAFEGYEGLSRIGEIKADIEENEKALAALAELERAAATPRLWLAEPVAGDYAGYENDIVSAAAPEWAIKRAQRCYYAEFRAVPLYAAPPAPVAEIREVAVTDEMGKKVYEKWIRLPRRIDCSLAVSHGIDMITAVRAELGPALGLFELREPTPEVERKDYALTAIIQLAERRAECADILTIARTARLPAGGES